VLRRIVLERPERLVATDAPAPTASAGEAVLRVHRVGVCGTDFHAFHGRQAFFTYPRVMGHELGAEILEAPDNDRGLRPGDRCTVEPYLNCGMCDRCREGHYNNCQNIRVLGVHVDGGMQELIAVPADHVYKSNQLSFDQLALIEPFSIGAQAIMRSKLTGGETLLVIGAGPIGVAVAQLALVAGAKVCVHEPLPQRRARVERMGAEARDNIADDEWADVVIDATGNADSMAQSLSRARYGGRVVWVGIVQTDVPVHDPLFHHRELTLLASRNSAGHFPRIIQMFENGVLDTSPWISNRVALDDVPMRFQEVTRHQGLKTMVEL